MTGSTKLAGFAAVLAVVFGGAIVAGGAIDPDRGQEDAPMTMTDHAAPQGGDARSERSTHDAGGGAHGAAGSSGHGDPVRGLAVAQDGLRVVVAEPQLARGARQRLAFRIERADGTVVRSFDRAHERRMHLIVVRRDLTGFQHLHPTMASDGTWTADLTVAQAGSHRLFADFSHDGRPYTLATDLHVDGPADLQPLPAPTPVATSDGGDRVTLAGDGDGPVAARAGQRTTLRFATARDGRPVEVEPHLGAAGHLVALRDGDLAFLHVHPSGDGVAFATTFPTAGRYRLFLQYKVAGRVETVAFTLEVAR